MRHQPKVKMCAVCVHIKEDCSHLPFKTMPTISRKPSEDAVIIVKCTSFKRKENVSV